MGLSHADVRGILMRARSFYKGGFKSSNKSYTDQAILNKPSRLQRLHWITGSENGPLTNNDRVRGLRTLSEEMSVSVYGRFLFQHGYTAGNCYEMCAMSAYLCKSFGGIIVQLGMFDAPMDHVFLLLSDSGNMIPLYLTHVAELDTLTGNHWIVDCWMNIACRAAEYSYLAAIKLNQWSQDGKLLEEPHGGFMDPSFTRLQQRFLTSSVQFRSAA